MFYMKLKNKRKSARKATCEVITCFYEGRVWKGILANYSAHGAFIETSHFPNIGKEIDLEFCLFQFTKNTRIYFDVKGLVVRTKRNVTRLPSIMSDGFGIKFRDLTSVQKGILLGNPKKSKNEETFDG